MPDDIKNPIWQLIYNWQTLIAGGLAIIAAVITVWGTMRAASKEIESAKEQSEEMKRRELRQRAAEGYAFHATLAAAMDEVLNDAREARGIFQPVATASHSWVTYEARIHIKKAMFQDLRAAFLRMGGLLIQDFIRLEKNIDKMAMRFVETPTANGFAKSGVADGFEHELRIIEEIATHVRSEAQHSIGKCAEVLKDEP